MFSTVAIPFDAFQALPRAEHRWLLTCFSRYVDRAGKAFPSLRQLARDARMSLASVSRYMTAMERLGVFQRSRQPGGRYFYQLAEAFRPRWPGRPRPAVPARQAGVPQSGRQQANPTKQYEKRLGDSADLPSAPPWEQRVRSFVQRGFWLPAWGATPTETGCLAPLAVLRATLTATG
ncbi:MAG: hypothetical protein ACJ8AW_14910 [Rhodopila sp.]